MTTETMSLSLSLRELLKSRYTLDYDDYPCWSLSFPDLDKAEATIRAEATAPLRQEIERLLQEVKSWHGLTDKAQRTAASAIITCEEATLERDVLRAENAALKQAGDALRDEAFRIADEYYVGELAGPALDDAIRAYDAAPTTPRRGGDTR